MATFTARHRLVAITLLVALTAMGACTKSGGSPQATGASPSLSTSASSSGPPSTSGGQDGNGWCAVAEQIGAESGIMSNKHFVAQANETLDMFKATVNLSLQRKDELLQGLPPDVKAALEVELEYFQMLQDSNFQTTAVPAGLAQALAVVKSYEINTCGFVFDE